ncbi:MAG: Secretory protein [Candidatus Saccharibacteria bacterium GW2011_GWC2_48_9]|nr:MAG: Secretory protein [Candidatus Saccharibacteria bacterium GW2011_GWC2_48_9]HCH34443.1 hypothetical protein [Candidatus Saccharibacteria bacterium]
MLRVGLQRKDHGFTIVELLIVIVVIGILAAITIVAFNGVQQRANNTSRINAVAQTIKLVKSYQATYGDIPLASGTNVCATTDNICSSWNQTPNTGNNTSLITELRKVGEPVASVKRQPGDNYGILYNVWTDISRGSETLYVFYWLEGQNQSCGMKADASNYTNGTTCIARVVTR